MEFHEVSNVRKGLFVTKSNLTFLKITRRLSCVDKDGYIYKDEKDRVIVNTQSQNSRAISMPHCHLFQKKSVLFPRRHTGQLCMYQHENGRGRDGSQRNGS